MESTRKALVIAIDDYQDPGLGRLRSPAQDAAALSEVLGDPAIGGFVVEVAANQPSHVVQARVEDFFLDAAPNDLLLLHFSGHGVKSESGELYFAATNTRPTRLGSTAVAADFVQRCMRTSRSRSVVLFLDCCYGGAFPQGAAVRAAGSLNVLGSFPSEQLGPHGRGRAVITASSSMEYAFEGDQLADDQARRPSVFTHALVQGLRTGDADRDEDGQVSLNELYDYLFDQVRDANPNQTPGRNVDLQGEIYIARSRRRRIHPTPLPADLLAAITDTSLFARLGAITELRVRLVSSDLGVARAAFDALLEMARHDIQQVAAAARVALADATLTPSETEVSFGDLVHGSTSPEHTIRLLVPPIARLAVPQTIPGWLNLRQDDDGLHLTVDTCTTARHNADLVIEGPTGQATIHLDTTIVNPLPEPPQPLPRPPAGQAPVDTRSHHPVQPAEVHPVPSAGQPMALDSEQELAWQRNRPPYRPNVSASPNSPPAVPSSAYVGVSPGGIRHEAPRPSAGPAGLGDARMRRRLAARMIDWLIVGVVAFIFVEVLPSATVGTTFLLGLAAMMLYEVPFLALCGATPGKQLVGVRVVQEATGALPSWGQSFLRCLILVVSGLLLPLLGPLLLYVSAFFDSTKRHRGWHDKIARALVVRV